MEHQKFPKIGRLSRDCVVTEKIDGTNAQIEIVHELALPHMSLGTSGDFSIFAGSRSRYLTLANDHFGFAKWVQANAEDLFKLGLGRHYGEWWGSGIQRGYGLKNGEKRFSLFNVTKWQDPMMRPTCCDIVPVLGHYTFDTNFIDATLQALKLNGSMASPGFMNPEGIVIFHTATSTMYKKTLQDDEKYKGET